MEKVRQIPGGGVLVMVFRNSIFQLSKCSRIELNELFWGILSKQSPMYQESFPVSELKKNSYQKQFPGIRYQDLIKTMFLSKTITRNQQIFISIINFIHLMNYEECSRVGNVKKCNVL